MNVLTILIAPAIFLFIILSIPDLLPKCSCCGAVKPRFLFRIHKSVRISLWHKANKSVCNKCCRKYEITTLRDVDIVNSVKTKVKSKENIGL